MLSGASSLTYATLTAEMLPCLPELPTLKSLHVHARGTMAVWDISHALMDCHQLRSLRVTCHEEGTANMVPEMDLRHMVNLRECHLDCVPAPHKLCLPQGELVLKATVTPDQMLSWNRLWDFGKVQNHVRCITVEGYPRFSQRAQPARQLNAWPLDIAAFGGLQFLQLSCEGMSGNVGKRQVLDLAHLAYIPYVSIRSTGHLRIRISAGSWKVLEIKGEGAFSVHLDNATAFLDDVVTFYFMYPAVDYTEVFPTSPRDLSEELKHAGAMLGKPVHEYYDISRFGDQSYELPMKILSNCPQDCSIEDNGFLHALLASTTCPK